MERRQSGWLCQVLCLQVNIINRMKNKVKIIVKNYYCARERPDRVKLDSTDHRGTLHFQTHLEQLIERHNWDQYTQCGAYYLFDHQTTMLQLSN